MRLLHKIVYTVLLFLLVTGAISVVRANAASTGLNNPVRIQEDSPGWNCHTMGNKICGFERIGSPRFRQYDRMFECFAEAVYTHPTLTWNERVVRCIPRVDTP